MLLSSDTENAVENILSSYETRIESFESLFETTHQVLQNFQERLFDAQQERESIHRQLRDNLAKNESLRKKDFDHMMSDLASHQDHREQEVKRLSRNYLGQQVELVRQLRDILRDSREALARGEAERLRDFRTLIEKVLADQQERKEHVVSKLKEFQKEQQEMAVLLKNLLSRGRELRIRDLKSMLADFKRQRAGRTARRQERRQEIRSLLGEFKVGRLEVAQTCSAAQSGAGQKCEEL